MGNFKNNLREKHQNVQNKTSASQFTSFLKEFQHLLLLLLLSIFVQLSLV